MTEIFLKYWKYLKLLHIHPFHGKVVGMEILEYLKKRLYKSVLLFFIKIPSGASESRPQISHLFRIRSVFRVNLSLQCCVFLLAKPKAVESHSFAKRSSESSLWIGCFGGIAFIMWKHFSKSMLNYKKIS